MTDHSRGMDINKQRIKELVDIAIHEDESLAKSGIEATFRSIVEPLNDSFDTNDRDVYYDVFSYVIHLIRELPEAVHIDSTLKIFGLFTQQNLLDRVKSLIDHNKTNSLQKQNVKKVFVLSRVTIGADVAITSIIIEKSKKIFPNANIFFLANKKNYELFGNDENIEILPLDYKRRGGLITRLDSWIETLKHIEDETRDIDTSEYVIIDSNSRITQLGLLPLVADDTGYYLFEPLAHADEEKRKLGEDVNEWLTKVFEEGDVEDITYPTLNIPAEYSKAAKEFYQKLADTNNQFFATVNFGVGGNDDKRISDEFEFEVVLHLIENGATVILDEGFGEDEIERADSIINQLKKRGKTIIKVIDDLSITTHSKPDLIAFKGGIGQFAALISQSHLYLGYDSMGQHVAAALEIPELVIFNGYPTEKFSRKWHPYGKGKIDIIHAEGISEREVLERTKQLLKY
ncbi:MAG: glycosyltransferase family 9 protein [Candidatus Brocadiaceae bacterium]|nr:glycosyltransferase family 9 protein [Candidatus Brocadiaceae bacterium]